MRILYVEDDPADQMAVARMFAQERLPYHLALANSAAQARTMLANASFDIVLCDYVLGAETAFDLLSEISHIPCVLVTGQGNQEIIVRAMKNGVYDYLTKDANNQHLQALPEVFESVHRRRQQEQQSQKQQTEEIRAVVLQEMLQDISHDLRTLLAGFGISVFLLDQNLVQLASLLDGASLDVQTRMNQLSHRCTVLKRHKNRFEQILLNMLDMLRIDALTTIDRVPQNLNCLVADLVRHYQERATEAQITLSLELSTETLQFLGDELEFRGILHQLLKNALQYTPSQGLITVRTSKVGKNLVLTVADTGIGIAGEEIADIFQRFYRSNKVRTMDFGNCGLGLSIVRKLVELHDGHIVVESQPGLGTTFTVYIPGLG